MIIISLCMYFCLQWTVVEQWFWSVRMGFKGLRFVFPVVVTYFSSFPVWKMVSCLTAS